MLRQTPIINAKNARSFTHVATLRLCIALLALAFSANAAEFGELMNTLRWQSRVLLVFSAEADDVRKAQFLEAVDGNRCEIQERDILIGHVDPAGESYIGDQVLSSYVSSQIRERLGIRPTEFRVVLVGKDGGVKATYERVPDLADVFRLIDGMPMRRREWQARSAPCTESP